MSDSTEEYCAVDLERWEAEAPKQEGRPRAGFARDRARVLHSSALRRLAAKTQVVVVGESDFPRTRLTHSLECAQLGRELAASVGADPDLVDAACLAHDLGHPPFGHNGETALAEIAESFGGFEGNAQSLRILTRLESKVIRADGSSAGLNLTRATLDAAAKYPWPRRSGTVKFGTYDDDRPVFDWMRDGAPSGERAVEAQVMDWADDVAYSVHDVEDGIHARLINPASLTDPVERHEIVATAAELFLADVERLEEAAVMLCEQPFWLRSFEGSMRDLAALKRMTSELTARLCSAAVAATAKSNQQPARRYRGRFVVPVAARAECAVLKAVATRYVMRRDPTVLAQVRQREQLTELYDAVLAGAPGTLEPWLHDAWREAPDDAARRRVVVDQVASLTDVSALAWHTRLRA